MDCRRKRSGASSGSFFDDGLPLGHRLRDRLPFAAPKTTVTKVPIVIVGGGMSGLSAAWRLNKKGFHDFVVLELEKTAGGNARSGENRSEPLSLGRALCARAESRGGVRARVIRGTRHVSRDGKYNERYLCFAPQERLFLYGRWQEGLEPEIAATRRDREQYRRFNDMIREQRATGQFTIPIEHGCASPPARLA